MELTPIQYRAVKKAKILLGLLAPRMESDERNLFNEVCSDWADIDFEAINYDHNEGILTSKSGLIQPGEDIRLV